MPLSTSSSKKRAKQNLYVSPAIFLVVFAILTAVGHFVTRNVEALAYTRPMPKDAHLPEGDWYASYCRGLSAFGHTVLYHGIGQSIDNAKKADLMFLGSSRVMFGFINYELIQPFAERHGTTYFNLGFGFKEYCVFPKRIIEKHDLRPGLVVVNADRFFRNFISEQSLTVVSDSSWEDFKNGIESRGEYLHLHYGRRIFPHFLPQIPVPSAWLKEVDKPNFRSSIHGSWRPLNWQDKKIPVLLGKGSNRIKEENLELARQFRDFIQERGGYLVFTYVPSARTDNDSRARAAELARCLDVPFLSPELEGLTTYDRSHLSPSSSDAFTSAFLELLERHLADNDIRPKGWR